MNVEKDLICEQFLDKSLEELVSEKKINYEVKNAEISNKSRLEGNELYRQKIHTIILHERILNLFSKSICFAPNGSEELAMAYGNRSALLLHMKKYKECNTDVDRALVITKSMTLKVKLFCRKVDCLTALGEPNNKTVLDEAIRHFENISEDNKNKSFLHSIISKRRNSLESVMKNLVLKDEDEHLKSSDPFKSVSIKYSEKYGRHLTAVRCFRPGEFIFIEKPLVYAPNNQVRYIHCSHCLAIAWIGIPCEFCTLCIFCSEECKNEAWNKYHDVECSIVTHLEKLYSFVPQNFQLCLRTLIMGMREAGDIVRFEMELRKINACTDKRTSGFSKDKKFESHFRSIYSLSYDSLEKYDDTDIRNTAIALAYVAKYTTFFGIDVLKNQSISDLAEIKDILLIGAVLLRLMKISKANAYSILNSPQRCVHASETVRCFLKNCGYKSLCFVPIFSLINNSCTPNVKVCFTRDQRIAVYAIEPVLKNSQIFTSYICSFYDTTSNINRIDILKQHYNFTCDCAACKNDWPAILSLTNKIEVGYDHEMHRLIEFNITKEYKDVIVVAQDRKTFDVTRKTISDLTEAIEKATKLLPQPNRIRCVLTSSMERAFEKLYGYDIRSFNCQS